MPTLDLNKKKLKYFASDESAIEKALTLCSAMAEYDPAAKQDATSASVSLKHLADYVKKQRSN